MIGLNRIARFVYGYYMNTVGGICVRDIPVLEEKRYEIYFLDAISHSVPNIT